MSEDLLNEFIYDANVERQIYLLRHRAGLVRKIKQALKKHDLEFTENLVLSLTRLSGADLQRLGTAAGFNTVQSQRFENLLNSFRESSGQTLTNVINEELNQLIEDEYDFQRETYLNGLQQFGLVSAFALSTKLDKPEEKRKLELSVGKTQDEIIHEWSERRKQKVLAVIRLSVQEENEPSIRKIIKDVSGTSSRFGGILRDTHYGAIVFGETLHQSAVTAGAMAVVEQAEASSKKNSDAISKIDLLWSSLLDSKTSSLCFQRHNKLIFGQLGGARPPGHPRCRSTTIPWFGGKKPPQSETVTKWFGRQSEDVKKRILGKTRYEAYSENSSNLKFP